MDHFSLGATTRHHSSPQHIGGNGNYSKIRISPVNFPVPGCGRHNNTSSNGNGSGGSNNNSQHNLYNFGSSPVLPHSIVSRGGIYPPGNFINPSPPNHFNFPLRSNNVNGGSNTTGRGGFSRGNIGSSGINQQQHNHNLNKSRPNNYNRQQSQNNENSKGTNQSNLESIPEPLPQYRIFKRGDSIPGIMSPTGVGNAGGGEDINDVQAGGATSPDKKLDISHCISSEGNPSIGQYKENAANGSCNDGDRNSVHPHKTPVSKVSDIARFHNLSVEYRLVGEKGPPHQPTFKVALHLGPNENYVGEGTSIKRAQHAAAIEAIEKTPLTRPTSASRSQPKRPFAGKRPNWALIQLTSLAEELKEPVSIVQQPVTLMNPFHRGDPSPPIVVSVHIGPRIFSGEGNNFNTAKNMALMIALKAMIKVRQEAEFRSQGSAGEDGTLNLENKSPISLVHEMAMKRDLTVSFDVTQEEGPPHSKVFTVLCALKSGDDVVKCQTEGQGPTKQAAKKVASELMIVKFGEVTVPMKSSEATSLKAIQRELFRQKTHRKKTSAPVVKDLQKDSVSPISRLIQIAHIRKYKEPEFTVVDSTVNSLPDDPIALKLMSERERRSLRKKKPSFTIEVSVGPYSNQGTGPNKKAAKKAAAEAVLIEMGYGPTPTESEEKSGSNDNNNGAHDKSGGGKGGKGAGAKSSKESMDANSNKAISGSVGGGEKIVSARQIVPGVLVLSSEVKPDKDSPDGSPSKSSAMAQEMKKMNSSPMASTSSAANCSSATRDAIEKLAYLANLIEFSVSYSDFPKKNEFLSVVSIGTNPPQVAHGMGRSVEEAQNMAATKILGDIADIGLDNVKPGETGGLNE